MTQSTLDKLSQASQIGDMEGIISILGEAKTTRAEKIEITLNYAVQGGFNNIISYLVDQGANINKLDSTGYPPLFRAVSRGFSDTCSLLINLGADKTATNARGESAIHIAVESEQIKVLKTLKKEGLNFEIRDYNGDTPLLLAARKGKFEIYQELIQQGAKENKKDREENSPLFLALSALIHYRIKKWEKDSYRIERGLLYKKNDTTALSLEKQEALSTESWFPLEQLFYLRTHKLCWWMIERLNQDDPFLKEKNKMGQTVFTAACNSGEPRLIEALYEKGASFALRDKEGAKALHYSAKSGRRDGLKMALKLSKGRGINSPNNYGLTPLHYLADVGASKACVDLLLSMGADKKAQTTSDFHAYKRGMTPADIANYWKDSQMAKYLSDL